ncbi:MAG: hypothetical protein AAF939_04090 [Planctomycetota bacterium]
MNKTEQKHDLSTTHRPANVEESDQPQPTAFQFKIVSLFWTMFLIGLGMAYLQRLNNPDILIDGAFAVSLGVVVGAIIGGATRKLRDGLFWATLVAAFAYLSTASDPIFIPPHRLAWSTVGAVTGSLAATVIHDKRVTNAILCGIASGMIMAGYAWISQRFTTSADTRIDVMLAPMIGIAVSAFVRVILWMESKQEMPRYITATWLLVAVILGNFFAQ